MFWAVYISILSVVCKLAVGDSIPITSTEITYRSVAYYVNWAIYSRKFYPQDLPVGDLTHILYAFANINNLTGEVYLSDTWADTDIHLVGDLPDVTGTNLYGCFKQLYLLKQKNRHLKVLLSIGGATYSGNFATPASTISGRSKFASSAVALVKNLGLDGLDIDWEFPDDEAQAINMVLLLERVREALDIYGDSLDEPYHFQLTVACPAGPAFYQKMHLADMDKYVDFWNLMAWDYTVSSKTITAANQANLFQSRSNPAATPFDTLAAIQYYVSQHIRPGKLVLGMPLYGRSFNSTDGIGKPCKGVGKGTWEDGVYDFKVLPLTGAVEHYDNLSVSSYSYDAISKELVSYDTITVAKQKAAWVRLMKLGGVMWWESSADGAGDKSLIRNTVSALRVKDGSGLDAYPNRLIFSDSTYDNLRAGMQGLEPDRFSTLNQTTTTVFVPCASHSKISNFTATYNRSSSASLTDPPIEYTTIFTTTTLPFTSYTTVVIIL